MKTEVYLVFDMCMHEDAYKITKFLEAFPTLDKAIRYTKEQKIERLARNLHILMSQPEADYGNYVIGTRQNLSKIFKEHNFLIEKYVLK